MKNISASTGTHWNGLQLLYGSIPAHGFWEKLMNVRGSFGPKEIEVVVKWPETVPKTNNTQTQTHLTQQPFSHPLRKEGFSDFLSSLQFIYETKSPLSIFIAAVGEFLPWWDQHSIWWALQKTYTQYMALVWNLCATNKRLYVEIVSNNCNNAVL